MIVWIDGPYGVGKSTLAREMRELLPKCHIFAAEEVGNAVRDNLPPELFAGYIFEGYPLWFDFCAALLLEIADRFDGDVLAPMTLTRPDSFEKIAQKLKAAGHDVRHVLLESDYDTVRSRILARGGEEGCWCMENIPLCLDAQREFQNVLRIPSFEKTPRELAEEVLAALEM